jgi:hypothetical protein
VLCANLLYQILAKSDIQPFTALIFTELINVQWHYMDHHLPNFKPSAKLYGKYRQKFIYALQESSNVTQMIFTTLKVARQRCKEL